MSTNSLKFEMANPIPSEHLIIGGPAGEAAIQIREHVREGQGLRPECVQSIIFFRNRQEQMTKFVYVEKHDSDKEAELQKIMALVLKQYVPFGVVELTSPPNDAERVVPLCMWLFEESEDEDYDYAFLEAALDIVWERVAAAEVELN